MGATMQQRFEIEKYVEDPGGTFAGQVYFRLDSARFDSLSDLIQALQDRMTWDCVLRIDPDAESGERWHKIDEKQACDAFREKHGLMEALQANRQATRERDELKRLRDHETLVFGMATKNYERDRENWREQVSRLELENEALKAAVKESQSR